MNASLRELNRRLDELPTPSFDIDGIIDAGDSRLRRRRAGLVTGAALSAVAAVVLGTSLGGGTKATPDPVQPAPSPPVVEPAVRALTYTDDYEEDWTPGMGPRWFLRSIRYGDEVLELDSDVMHVDETDDGLVLLAKDAGVFFADGTTVDRIGQSAYDHGSVTWSDAVVETANAGSLVAWLTPASPNAVLVVYDTSTRERVAESAVAGCPVDTCSLKEVVGDRVYLTTDYEAPELVFDVSDGTVRATNLDAFWRDLRSMPRSFVTSNDYDRGEVVSDEAIFVPVGDKLKLQWFVRATGADVDGDGEGDGEPIFGYGGFDTMGRSLDLRLPDGYRPASDYKLFQWLDDDRFAVMAGAGGLPGEPGPKMVWGGGPGYGDVLVCDIAAGRCELGAEGPRQGFRLVPHVDVPN